jgi:hypothetical protein
MKSALQNLKKDSPQREIAKSFRTWVVRKMDFLPAWAGGGRGDLGSSKALVIRLRSLSVKLLSA